MRSKPTGMRRVEEEEEKEESSVRGRGKERRPVHVENVGQSIAC
jgi:hypothetical protein